MTFIVQSEAPPFQEDASGALRIGSTRVLLELVIHSFQDGATPETIVQQYTSLALSDVYATIAYYLRHRDQIDSYLAERERSGQELRKKIESAQGDMSEIRRRLMARKQK